MLAIFKREFRSYFQTVIGWLFIAVSLCIYGLYYYVYNFANGKPDITYVISSITFICLITVPILSMRCLSDEKRTRTDQLILTSPVSVGKLVLGKFLALAAVFSITVLVYIASAFFLCLFGTVALKTSFVAVFGYWLFGLACIAVCVFVSSITESQVIAAVLSFLALFFGYMMGSISSLISSTGNIITKILGCYNLSAHMNNFMNGCLDVNGIVYYLTVVAIFLFLATQSIQKRRWTVTKNSWKTGAFSTTFIAVTVALAVIVNFVVGKLPTTITNIDVTSQKLYSITDASYKVLDSLTDDVTIYVIAKESTADATLAETLKRYEDGSKHVKVEYKDPSVSPNFYTTYTDTAPSANSLIVVSDKRSRVVDYSDVYEKTVDYNTYSQTITGYDGEGIITSAISYVTSDNMPKVYVIEGHNETAFADDFSTAFEKANISTENINLIQYDAIPEDASGIIINAPTSDFSKDDANKVKDYLKAGGKALISLCYTKEKMDNFNSILSDYQVSVADGVVVEGNKNSYYQVPFYILPEIASSELTSGCTSTYIFAPYAVGMTYPQELSDDTLTITKLLTTSDESFAKANVENAESYDKEKGDTDGPFALGLYIKQTAKSSDSSGTSDEEAKDDPKTSDKESENDKETNDKKESDTEIMLFSSSTMFTQQANQMVSGNNLTMFSNCINKFKGTEESNIVIPVKAYDFSKLTIASSTGMAVALFGIIIIPLGLLILGIVIWIRRRKK